MDLKKIIENAKHSVIESMDASGQIDRLDRKLDTFHFNDEDKIKFYEKLILAANAKIQELKKADDSDGQTR